MTATVYRTAGTMFEATKGCSRRSLLAHLGLASVFLTSGSGCTSLWGRSDQSGDSDAALQKLLKVPDPPDLIGTAAVPSGLKFVRVEGVGVVNDLPSTGGPAQPSGYRDQLLEEMKRRDVVNPNQYLERDDTALVRVNALIPPGARRGDRIDVTLSAPVKTEATNLHGGWLLDTRLRHQQSLGGAVRSSDVMAIAMGSVLTRFDHEGRQDLVTRIEGKLLSGGIVQTDRRLGLILRPEFQHVKMASAIAAAINRRFYFFDGTTRRGIAKAVEDDFIEIDVHPRYRGNEFRMMETLRGLGVAPESAGTQARLVELGKQLRDVSTAADAAIKLEGMGENAIPTLIDATTQSNPELKFYAAEALAYLDRAEAI
ncbi:MAG: flagellar basal body P-ring protein FlgI, partial [Planctomycetota bacterium]